MTARISLRHSDSGCWIVRRGDIPIHIYSPHMWRHAYVAAFEEAVYQNLGVVRIDTA